MSGVIFLATLIAFAVGTLAIAAGVLLGRKQPSGSCGGLAGNVDPDGNPSCSVCSRPTDCSELQKRVHGESGAARR